MNIMKFTKQLAISLAIPLAIMLQVVCASGQTINRAATERQLEALKTVVTNAPSFNITSNDIVRWNGTGTITNGVTVGTVSMPVGTNTLHIDVDVTQYNLVTAFVVMPNDATTRYSVSMIRADDTGFVVVLSSTMSEIGYSIRYTICKKG